MIVNVPPATGEVGATIRAVAGILDAVARGLDEAGMPLTPEQVAFLNDAARSPLGSPDV